MDLAQMLVEFVNSTVPALWTLLWVLGGLAGFVCTGIVLNRMIQSSKQAGQVHITPGQIAAGLIIAACMSGMSQFLNITWQTFGAGMISFAPMSYANGSNYGKLAPAVNAALTLGAVYGGYKAFSGIYTIWRANMRGHSSHGEDDLYLRGLTKVIAGVFLIQGDKLIELARKSFNLFF